MIAIDTEYIPSNAVQGKVPGERPNVEEVYCEVMQIGACKLDEQGTEIAVLNITVLPNVIETIPEWLVTMTGMTPEKRLEKGVDFATALDSLVTFIPTQYPVASARG